MPIRLTEEPAQLTVHISGDIDHHGARGLMLSLDREVSLRDPRRLVVDMGEVTFMDSSGIAVLLRCWRRMGQGAMEVRGVPPQALKVFSTAGLDKIIPMAGLSAAH